MIKLSDDQFRLMCPRLPSARRAELLPLLNEALERFEINTPRRVAAFVSNLMHESASFKYAREIWGPTPAQLRYEPPSKKARQLGNVERGDGQRFMGRGFIQTTGRANYRRVGIALGLPLLDNPGLLEQPRHAMLSAAYFWSDNKLNGLADCLRGKRDASEVATLKAICKRINGGVNGLAERVANYWRCLAVLNETPAAVEAQNQVERAVASSPHVPTPETHTPEQLAAAAQNPLTPIVAAAAEVHEQEKAAALIDLAEKTPASVMQATANSLWSRTGGRVMQLLGVFFAALQAGSFFAWGGTVVLVLALLVVLYRNRHDLRRWLNCAGAKVKESVLGA